MVVADDWQGRGAGTRLLDALVERAREEGIRRFEAPVLAYNTDAIHVLERLGETTREPQGTRGLSEDRSARRGAAARVRTAAERRSRRARWSPAGPCSSCCGRGGWARRATRRAT